MKKRNIILIIIGILISIILILAFWMIYQTRDLKISSTKWITESVATLNSSSNMYLVKTNDGNYIAIDAGANPGKLLKECKLLGVDPLMVKAVFLTHTDMDHAGGLKIFTAAKVYLSRDEEPLLKGKNRKFLFGIPIINRLAVSSYETISDGEVIEAGGIKVKAILAPGHTAGSTSYLIDGSLFTGDLLIIKEDKIYPMLPIFTENMEMDKISIGKIARLSGVKALYTAHTGYQLDTESILEQAIKEYP